MWPSMSSYSQLPPQVPTGWLLSSEPKPMTVEPPTLEPCATRSELTPPVLRIKPWSFSSQSWTTPVQVIVPSTTVRPGLVGHAGSTAPLVPPLDWKEKPLATVG